MLLGSRCIHCMSSLDLVDTRQKKRRVEGSTEKLCRLDVAHEVV